MKVIRTIESFYPYVTGPANQAFRISEGLYKKGVESPIFTTDFNVKNVKEKEYFGDVLVRRFKVKRKIMKYCFTPSMKKAFKEFDIIHSHNYRSYQSSLGYKMARKRRKPFVINTHGTLLAYKNFNMGLLSKVPYYVYDLITSKKIVKKADMVIAATGQEYKESLEFGVKKERLRTIPVGINIKDYEPVKKDYSVINLLFVGRISRNRNLGPIIKAMGILKNEKIKLTIVGGEVKSSETSKTGYVDELKKLANGLNIEFTGPKYGKELINYYKKSDIFVYTSFYENFGQTMLEAGAAGLPIIATKTGIANDIVKDNKTGFIVGPNNPKEIAEYIKELSDKNKRAMFRKRIREIIKKNFDWDNIIERYVEIYKEIM